MLLFVHTSSASRSSSSWSLNFGLSWGGTDLISRPANWRCASSQSSAVWKTFSNDDDDNDDNVDNDNGGESYPSDLLST